MADLAQAFEEKGHPEFGIHGDRLAGAHKEMEIEE
jgi:hypothetical protein